MNKFRRSFLTPFNKKRLFSTRLLRKKKIYLVKRKTKLLKVTAAHLTVSKTKYLP